MIDIGLFRKLSSFPGGVFLTLSANDTIAILVVLLVCAGERGGSILVVCTKGTLNQGRIQAKLFMNRSILWDCVPLVHTWNIIKLISSCITIVSYENTPYTLSPASSSSREENSV